MGNAEGLVQVQVTDIAAKFAWGGHAHQRIHVGAVDVHAAAVLVHQRVLGAKAFEPAAAGSR